MKHDQNCKEINQGSLKSEEFMRMCKPQQAKRESVSDHTPTPWKVRMYGEKNRWASFQGPDEMAIGDTNVSARSPEEALANAAFIIRAVNAHEELVEALKKITEVDSDLSNETNAYYEAWTVCKHIANEAIAELKGE